MPTLFQTYPYLNSLLNLTYIRFSMLPFNLIYTYLFTRQTWRHQIYGSPIETEKKPLCRTTTDVLFVDLMASRLQSACNLHLPICSLIANLWLFYITFCSAPNIDLTINHLPPDMIFMLDKLTSKEYCPYITGLSQVLHKRSFNNSYLSLWKNCTLLHETGNTNAVQTVWTCWNCSSASSNQLTNYTSTCKCYYLPAEAINLIFIQVLYF